MRPRSRRGDSLKLWIRAATFVCIGVAACTPPSTTTQAPVGTTVQLTTTADQLIEGELIVFGDTVLVLTDRLVGVPLADLSRVQLVVPPQRIWMGHTFLVNVIPGAVLAFTEAPAWSGWAASALGVITWIAMDLAEPPSIYAAPFDAPARSQLCLRARFPYGASASVLEQVRPPRTGQRP